MPSVFISYSHDPADPTHGKRVARLAASLLRDGVKVFFDQNRGDEEQGLPWPIWMEDKIDVADHVLLVCTELYWKKVRQKVAENEGRGVCWEANIVYALLYERKLNTTKFSPIIFSPADSRFIPTPLKGRDCFTVDSQSGYDRLYAFVTYQDRIHFPEQGPILQTIAQEYVEPLFKPPEETAVAAQTNYTSVPDKPLTEANLQLTLKPYFVPASRQDIRGLDWYDECDADHFIGRDQDANSILAMLLSHPIIRLIGPSGVGKSSLIYAGLLPKIRKADCWRACVIRPFEDPARRISSQLTAQLLTSAGAFTTPLDPAKFRAEVVPILFTNGIERLVVFLDQFEDVVSSLAAPAALDVMREFLQELWEHRESKPHIRAVVVYRTDADARLGRLWQEVSGRREGLPYFALQNLNRNVAEDIINQTAREQSWQLETSVSEITQQLVLESEKLDCSGEVFPVYLQIFLKQVEQSTEKRITAEFMTSLGNVSGLIGKYLEQALARLKSRGGEWEKFGAILESLSRSSGAKPTQSLNDLVRETGVSRAVLADMLRELIDERLVRPVGHESYEIQHDRLAAAVIENMKNSDRDAKAAREFLAAKVPVFEWTMNPLLPWELVYLYRNRRKIHPTERELRVLLASMLHNIEARSRNESPGAYWLGGASLQDFLRWFIHIKHWAAKKRSSFHPSDEWVKTFPISSLDSQFVVLATDQTPTIRAICAEWIGRIKSDKDLSLLRKLVNDDDLNVRVAAVKALANFSKQEDLPLLRELVKDEDSDVQMRVEAVKALAHFSRPEDLPLLCELAKVQDLDVSVAAMEAMEALSLFPRPEDLSLLQELARDRNSEVSVAAVKALKRLASFSRPENLPLLRELARNSNSDVCASAVKTLASFSEAEDLPLLRELVKDRNSDVLVRVAALDALALSLRPEDLLLLRELIKDQSSEVRVRVAALEALALSLRPEDLLLLRKLARDLGNPDIRVAAVKALARFSKQEDLLLLRELVKHTNTDARVRVEAVRSLAYFPRSAALPLLRELFEDQGADVRVAAMEALASFSRPEDLPLLCKVAKDEDWRLRTGALNALVNLSRPEDLPLLRELVKDQNTDVRVRVAAMEALISFSRPAAPPLLRELVKDKNLDVRVHVRALMALASFSEAEDLPLLRELIKDRNLELRLGAMRALANFAQTENLPLLRELAKDSNPDVRARAVKTLASFSKDEDLPLLRKLAKDEDSDVRAQAVEALGSLSQTENLPLLRELVNDNNSALRARAVEALGGFARAENLLLLRELVGDKDSDVRAGARRGLARLARAENLPLLREWALLPDDKVAAEAVRGLASLFSPEELEMFLNQYDQELCGGALTALDELLYMPEWLKAKGDNA